MTVYEVRISDWSSAVCSSDLRTVAARDRLRRGEDETGDRAAEDRAADLQHHLGRRRGADRLENVDLALRARHRFVDVDRAHQIVGQPRARLVASMLQLLLKAGLYLLVLAVDIGLRWRHWDRVGHHAADMGLRRLPSRAT